MTNCQVLELDLSAVQFEDLSDEMTILTINNKISCRIDSTNYRDSHSIFPLNNCW